MDKKSKREIMAEIRDNPHFRIDLNTPDSRVEQITDIFLDIFHKRHNIKKRKMVRPLIKLVLENLLFHRGKYISCPIGERAYKDLPSRYNPLNVSGKAIRRVIKYFEEEGLIDLKTGWKYGKVAFVSRIKETKRFQSYIYGYKLGDIEFEVDPRAEILELKRAKWADDGKKQRKNLIDYQESEFTNSSREFLRLLNEYYRSLSLTLDGRKISKSTKRVFNDGTFDRGGRFYGPYQNLKSKGEGSERSRLRINGELTSEVDFKGMHIQLLYIMSGHGQFKGDVYLTEGFEEYRNLFKEFLQAVLNSGSKEIALKSMNMKINFSGLRGKIDAKKALESFEKKHAPILPYFYSRIGAALQRTDSKIAEIVLKNGLNENVPVFSIHDSFIVPESKKNWLITNMHSASREVLGESLEVS